MISVRGKNIYTTSEIDAIKIELQSEVAKLKKEVNSVRAEIGQIKVQITKLKQQNEKRTIRDRISIFLGNAKSLLEYKKK